METATIWQRSGRWAHLQQQASLHGQSAKSPSSVVQVSAARLSFAALLPSSNSGRAAARDSPQRRHLIGDLPLYLRQVCSLAAGDYDLA